MLKICHVNNITFFFSLLDPDLHQITITTFIFCFIYLFIFIQVSSVIHDKHSYSGFD